MRILLISELGCRCCPWRRGWLCEREGRSRCEEGIPIKINYLGEVQQSNKDKIILPLCASQYGGDSKPYRDAACDVRLITEGIGVENYHPPKNVYGIIANPHSTTFSIAQAFQTTIPCDLRVGMWTCPFFCDSRLRLKIQRMGVIQTQGERGETLSLKRMCTLAGVSRASL